MGALSNAKPLFVESRKALFAALRLSDADTGGEDRQAIMDRAMLWARTEFYRRLGKQRVDEILATAEVAAPSTDEELDRTRAAQLEIWLVKYRLYQDLPVLFRDQSGESLLQHNVEAMVREPGPDMLGKALALLWQQIEDAFAELDDDEDTNAGSMQAMSIGPKSGDAVVEPGRSVFRHPQNPWLAAKHFNDDL